MPAFGLLGKFWELPEDQQVQMIELNIGALTQLTRLCLPGMVERRSGYVLNVASHGGVSAGAVDVGLLRVESVCGFVLGSDS